MIHCTTHHVSQWSLSLLLNIYYYFTPHISVTVITDWEWIRHSEVRKSPHCLVGLLCTVETAVQSAPSALRSTRACLRPSDRVVCNSSNRSAWLPPQRLYDILACSGVGLSAYSALYLFSTIISPRQCQHHHYYRPSLHHSSIPNSKLSYFSNPTLHRHLAPFRTDFTDTWTALWLFSLFQFFSSFQLSFFLPF